MITLTKKQMEEMLTHARQALPNEACGLLGGRKEGDDRWVERVYLLNNLDQSPEHFSMDPREQLTAVKDMRKNGWVMLGNFHSHPATPARPSAEDKRLAFDSSLSYLIISLAEPQKPVCKSFLIKKDGVDEEEIILKEE